MKIKSLTEISNQYEIIEVEISFLPGLPQIHFLGRADNHLKESALRIRSAFRACGFQFPQTQKIVVNLTPSHLKKVSTGIELAVALGILQMTDQVTGTDFQNYVIFGELSLEGEVQFPALSRFIPDQAQFKILSGRGLEQYQSGFQIEKLIDATFAREVPRIANRKLKAPLSPVSHLTIRQAQALKILCVGEHHALIAGSQGSGKTMLVEALQSLMNPPSFETLNFHESHFSQKLNWRPVARPHHTVSPLSMVGGGVPPKPGEITRAHGGLLFLDEMMEFKSPTLEVLREALSSQKVTVSRGLQSKSFLADFQMIGTTNLCPCGKWTPGKMRNCSFNEKRCRSVLQKLSGPLMDRLQGFLYFDEKAERPKISVDQVKTEIQKVREFQKTQNRKVVNRLFDETNLSSQELTIWNQFNSNFELSSVRRRQATLSWARTLADLDLSPDIKAEHLQGAYADCVLSLTGLLKQ